VPLGTNEQADVVDARVLGDVDLALDLGTVFERIQNKRVKVLHQIQIGGPHELVSEVVGGHDLHVSISLGVYLLPNFFFRGVTPDQPVLSALGRLAREVDEVSVGRHVGVWVEIWVRAFELLGRLLQLLEAQQLTVGLLGEQLTDLFLVLLVRNNFLIRNQILLQGLHFWLRGAGSLWGLSRRWRVLSWLSRSIVVAVSTIVISSIIVPPVVVPPRSISAVIIIVFSLSVPLITVGATS